MIGFFQYFRGYVRIKVSGDEIERFLNLCVNKKIFLWSIECYNTFYVLCISIYGFFQLQPIVKKTRVKVVILEKNGLPFFMKKIMKRKYFALGAFICIFYLLGMSNYIWSIEVTGNSQITQDVLMDFLKEEGVQYGCKISGVNIEQLETDIRNEFPIVTWTSAKLMGTKLWIQIKENETEIYTQEAQTDKAATGKEDMTAPYDGKIVSIITRRGVPLVKEQEEVTRGTVLVSGSIPIYNEEGLVEREEYCKADADIMIQHVKRYQEVVEKRYTYKEYYPEISHRPFLEIGGFLMQLPFVEQLPFAEHLPFWKDKTAGGQVEYLEKKSQVKILDNFYLPIFYGERWRLEYSIQTRIYSDAEIEEMLTLSFEKFLAGLEEKGVQIVSKNVTIIQDNERGICSGNLTLIEKIEM